jgi:hypothetical protein
MTLTTEKEVNTSIRLFAHTSSSWHHTDHISEKKSQSFKTQIEIEGISLCHTNLKQLCE